MKTRRVLLFCFLATVILISSTSGAARTGIAITQAAPSSSGTVDPLELSGNPNFVIITKGEIIYMMSRDNLTLDRWSMAERKYLIPVFSLKEAPDFIAYSEETNRIYLSYPNRRITQIKLDEAPLREVSFVNTPQQLKGLVAVGSFIFTSDSSKHYTYSPQGFLISQVDRPTSGAFYTWSPGNRRLYYFVDPLYPNDFQWEEIGLDGVITTTVAPPHHSEFETKIPLQVKSDGSLLFFGSGTLLDGATLERQNSFAYIYKDALWNEDDLFTVRYDQNKRNSILEKFVGQYYERKAIVNISGSAFRLFEVSEGILVVSRDDSGALLFFIFDIDLNIVYETPIYPTYVPLVDKDHCRDLFDDFAHPATGWPVGEDEDIRTEYLNGEYRILTKNDEYYYMFQAPSGCQRQYYQVEVDARWEGAPGHSYGIIYDINEDWSQYYIFIVNSEYQVYGLYWYLEEYGYLYEYALNYSSAILPDSNTNHMKVTRRYDNLLLEINGTIVLEKNDPDNNAPSGVGLVVFPYDEYPIADARFDNFEERYLNRDEIHPDGLGEPALNQGCDRTGLPASTLHLKMEMPGLLVR